MPLNTSSSQNTPFTPNADKVAQFTGSGNPPAVSSVPVYAAAINLNQILVNTTFARIPGVNATSAACAVTSTYVGPIGARISVMCASVAAGTVTYTFGAGFKVSATAAATTLTAMTVNFISDGTNWIEVSRSLAITF